MPPPVTMLSWSAVPAWLGHVCMAATLRIPHMVQVGWDARPASRHGSDAMAMHEISSVPAAGHDRELPTECQAMATGS